MKLTLGQAAKHAGRAKGTLSKALNNGHISAEKDGKGRWQIDPSELQRWIDANPLLNSSGNQSETHIETPRNPIENNGVSVEVKLLREQIERLDTDRMEERNQLKDQIENLRTQIERQSADHRQALAIITDQRPAPAAPPRRRLWGLLKG